MYSISTHRILRSIPTTKIISPEATFAAPFHLLLICQRPLSRVITCRVANPLFIAPPYVNPLILPLCWLHGDNCEFPVFPLIVAVNPKAHQDIHYFIQLPTINNSDNSHFKYTRLIQFITFSI